MKQNLLRLLMGLVFLPQIATAQVAAAITGSGQKVDRANAPQAHLKERITRGPLKSRGGTRQVTTADFSSCVLRALSHMPKGGGYSVKAPASRNLSTKAVVWDESTKRLNIDVQAAQPSFCSGASYVVLLHALEIWQQTAGVKLPPAAWKAMDVKGQADGAGIWGRANANGPGFSKLVHDLKAGANFTALASARPGDFLKFFWNEEIGAKERGHMVVFLGTEQKDGEQHIRYWSANMPDGYSERSVPLSKMHHLIFTRITHPENFAEASALPTTDTWLRDMQKNSVSFEEVSRICNIKDGGACSNAAEKVSAPPSTSQPSH